MQTENQPLIRSTNNSTSTVEKPKFHKGLFAVVLLVTAIFCVSAIYHRQIGHLLGMNKNSDTEVIWSQIETIETQFISSKWVFTSACDDDTSITLTMAIKQENTDKLEEELLKVSDPKSADYGKHWSFEKVHDFLKPSESTKSKVYAWLESNGIAESSIESVTPNGDFIRIRTDVSTANRLLNTQYGYWTHSESGKTHMRVVDTYYVPKEVSEAIDFISPTIRFPVESYMHSMELIGTRETASKKISADTTYVTPSTLKDMYGLGSMKGGMSSDNIQVIASFLEEWYSDTDLAQFWDFFSIDETTVSRYPSYQPEGYGSEAELDVQYITSTGEGVETIVWDIEDDLYFISLLEQIEESDIIPSVVSMSYGGDEQSNGEGYCNRGNTEFAKVGLLGITFFASSGDSGSVSSSGTCSDSSYSPSFPASSPYVTAVGGTTGGSSSNLEADGSGSTGETAWYYSGGGFSVYFDAKDFQTDAVDDFFNNAETLPDSSRYNRDGAAYPDLSAQSVAYVICYESGYYAVSGTSCSCPAVAGMFALINDMRLVSGKSRLGWINPSLYSLYSEQSTFFNDVTEGYNEGCSEDDSIAWYAQSGWDPITGMGTPKFSQLLSYFYELDSTDDDDESSKKASIFRYRN